MERQESKKKRKSSRADSVWNSLSKSHGSAQKGGTARGLLSCAGEGRRTPTSRERKKKGAPGRKIRKYISRLRPLLKKKVGLFGKGQEAKGEIGKKKGEGNKVAAHNLAIRSPAKFLKVGQNCGAKQASKNSTKEGTYPRAEASRTE